MITTSPTWAKCFAAGLTLEDAAAVRGSTAAAGYQWAHKSGTKWRKDSRLVRTTVCDGSIVTLRRLAGDGHTLREIAVILDHSPIAVLSTARHFGVTIKGVSNVVPRAAPIPAKVAALLRHIKAMSAAEKEEYRFVKLRMAYSVPEALRAIKRPDLAAAYEKARAE